MELSKFTVNCAKSAQFADPCPESHEICTVHTNFPRFSVPIGKIAKIRSIRVLLYFCRFCVIHTRWETTQAGAHSVKSAMYLLISLCFIILGFCKARCRTLLGRIMQILQPSVAIHEISNFA